MELTESVESALRVVLDSISTIPILRIHGEVDLDGAEDLREAISGAMSGSAGRLIVDLEDCTYIDSAGLAVLFTLVSWARQRGGRIAAVRPTLHVLHILKLVRLTDERGFQVFSDLESAHAALA